MLVDAKAKSNFEALELFCGMGGLSYGFLHNGFRLTGVDISEQVGQTFTSNKMGVFIKKNLLNSSVEGQFDVVLGGPPCQPWSCLNLTKRGQRHPLYGCLSAFFREVDNIKPEIFIMENVPAIQKDPLFLYNLGLASKNYDLMTKCFKYSDYGAAFARRRLFVIGVKREAGVSPSLIANSIEKQESMTVRQRIANLRNKKADPTIDHIWPNVKTIEKYLDYYQTGKYGWYILDWDKASPSFGNITKTYILHPDSFKNGNGARPISVREALRIIGFEDDFNFPEKISLAAKYEMLASAVSPIFSLKLGSAVNDLLSFIRKS